MQNPWHQLPENPPYVLAQDQPTLALHNKKAKAVHRVHLDVLPEPTLGLPDAPVVLLNANPGFSGKETIEFFTQPHVYDLCRRNLLHQELDYPFCLLDPGLDRRSGARWWSQKLKPLIELAGRKSVAERVLCVEYFPYRSPKFGPTKRQLYSQQYSFHLVRQAVQRQAVIVMMRSAKQWHQAVPELDGYANLFALNSSQNVTISQKNCPEGFGVILNALLN